MENTKGIILSGGEGSRLSPSTISTSKQLLPVYDKPLIYYPLTTLMLAGIKDILIITTPKDKERFEYLLKNGSQWGIKISYIAQEKPRGVGEALKIGKDFINNNNCVLILGDNIFYGNNLINLLKKSIKENNGATIFAYEVKDTKSYGVVEFNKKLKPIKLIEKPIKSKSNYSITGLYVYDKNASTYAKKLKQSNRGEYEITDLNKIYLQKNKLKATIMGRGYAWFDVGTNESLLEASQFIFSIEKRHNFKIACPEEIAFRQNYINKSQLLKLSKFYKKNEYGKYLLSLINKF